MVIHSSVACLHLVDYPGRVGGVVDLLFCLFQCLLQILAKAAGDNEVGLADDELCLASRNTFSYCWSTRQFS
jgi:hypothetical protein